MRAWWYTTPLASQLIRKQVGGFIFDVGLLGPCGKHVEEAEDVASMPRMLQSMPRTLRGMPRRPRTLPSMPRRPRTLPSMPRSCQASLHILGSYNCIAALCIFPWEYWNPCNSMDVGKLPNHVNTILCVIFFSFRIYFFYFCIS